jgi:hypothetical protein
MAGSRPSRQLTRSRTRRPCNRGRESGASEGQGNSMRLGESAGVIKETVVIDLSRELSGC